MVKVMFLIWSLLLNNLWHLALPNANSFSLEVIFGTPLCKQEFVLQEATASMGLEVRLSRTLVGKRWQESTIKFVPWWGRC